MKKLALTLLFGILGVGVYGQTIKTLGFNTANGQVVANTGTNFLTFTNSIWLSADVKIDDGVTIQSEGETYIDSYFRFNQEIRFNATNSDAASFTRANLGLGLPVLTNTNNANFLNDLGVGTNSSPTFDTITTGTNGISVGTAGARFSQSTSGGGAAIGWQGNSQRISFIGSVGMRLEESGLGIAFGASNTNGAAITRTNLGLGATWLTNVAGGVGSAIIGSGPNNTVSGNGNFSVIVGGRDHAVSGGLSVVLGGRSNEVTANYSIAAGTAAKAVHFGSFVFADYGVNAPDLISFSSTNDNSFNVRAAGGMSLDLGTNGIIFRTNVSADATRTNLGLGNGITTNRTFVSYDGTNYTTNSVTISNGIITGWTQ